VFDHEPLGPEHELLSLENTVLLPHVGYVSESTLRSMYGDVVQNVAAYIAGAPIRVIT
jgi:phosphoglycerate dehydrogenase-like enzyme